MTRITDERLKEMIGAGVPCVPANGAETAAMVRELIEARHLIRRVPAVLNKAFGAGMEEREGGSERRQRMLLESVDAMRDEIRSLQEGFNAGD